MSWSGRCLPLRSRRIEAVFVCDPNSVLEGCMAVKIAVIRLVWVLEEQVPLKVQVVHGM